MKGSKPGGGDIGKVVPLPGMSGAPTPEPVPDAPRDLSPYAQAFWREEAPKLAGKGRLKGHEAAFKNLCRLAGLMREIETADPTYVDANGVEQRAELYWMASTRNGVQMKSHKMITDIQNISRSMTQLMTLFGMTPLDDVRIKNPDQGNLFQTINDAMNGTSGDAS